MKVLEVLIFPVGDLQCALKLRARINARASYPLALTLHHFFDFESWRRRLNA